jgi:hypothetical protein
MAFITRPSPAQPANSQKTGNGQWSKELVAPVSATEFEERPLRGANLVCVQVLANNGFSAAYSSLYFA